MTSTPANEESLFVESSTRRDMDGTLVSSQLVMERCPDCGQVTQFEFKHADLVATAPKPITREYTCHCDGGGRRRKLSVIYLSSRRCVEVVQFVARKHERAPAAS